MNYGELKAQVRSYMHRIDLDAEIPGFIELARQRINRDLRAREMILQVDVTPTVNPFPLQADFLEMRDIYHATGTRRVTLALVGRKQLNDQKGTELSQPSPQFYSIDGLQIETSPDGIGVDFTELYYARQPELVNDSDTNPTLDAYPTIWLYGALIEGHSFVQDVDLQDKATGIYTAEVTQANTRSAEAESGVALQVQGASQWL